MLKCTRVLSFEWIALSPTVIAKGDPLERVTVDARANVIVRRNCGNHGSNNGAYDLQALDPIFAHDTYATDPAVQKSSKSES